MKGVATLTLACGLVVSGCGGDTDIAHQLKEGSPKQRAEAAAFMGAQRVAEAVPALREALLDTSEEVRAKAIWALGAIRSKAALEDLIPLVKDPSRRVRQQAVQALAAIEEPEAIPSLEAALEVEEDEWIRKDIEAGLEYLRQFQGETYLGEGSFR